MSRRRYPQKLYLFLCYGALSLVLFCAFFAYFYRFYANNIYNEAKMRSENMCASVMNSIETGLNNLSTISMNVVYSNVIRDNFAEFSNAEGYVETRPGVQSIYNTIISMIGVYQSASQVNLYTFESEMIGTGYFQRALYSNLKAHTWYEPTVSLNGHRYITQPVFFANIPAEGENQKIQKFISMTRIFFDKGGNREGIVEVIQDCNKIFALIPELRSNVPSMSCYVFNERGELVYPYWDVQPPENLLEKLGGARNRIQAGMVKLDDGSEMLASIQRMERYGWSVIIMEPEETVFSGLYAFRNSFLVIIVLIILITMLICFLISVQLTRPLNRLANVVKTITLDKVLDVPQELQLVSNSRIQEITLLYQSFQTMQERLGASLSQVLLAHTEETKAKFQVTQSLINPHFLYNSLTNISVMAEEGMNPEIIRMCQMLCDYFRYISGAGEMLVALERELVFTEKFIICMQMRFGADFKYSCDIDHEIRDIMIPKLIVQPFVENVFKHAFTIPPPWFLAIRAYRSDSHWYIDIEDNGCTLSDKKKQALLESYHSIQISDEYASLNIGGMGLKNVYLRLKMLYGNEAVFSMDNQNQSTIFTIGGPICREKEHFHG